LTDEHLVEIAESKGQPYLVKIAERRQLSPKVTDVLVNRGDHSVVKTVAANSGARFSNMGMSALAMRAGGDDALIEIIARRVDIPSLMFGQLLSYATHQTRARLLAARPENSALVDQALKHASADASRLASMAKDWVVAQQFIQSFGQDTELTRARVLEFADGGKITELVAALAVLSEIQMDLIGRLICDQSGFGAMVLCKALNLEWPTAHSVLMAGPSAAEREDQLEAQCDDFERLSISTARRLLSYWHGRMKTRVTFEGALA
jgi:hypothetical protein